MRRRLVVSTIAIVLVVLGTLAFPIGVIVYDAAEKQLITRLEVQAQNVAAAIEDDLAAGRPPDYEAAERLLSGSDGMQVLAADGSVLFDDPPSGDPWGQVVKRFPSDGTRLVILTERTQLDNQFRDQVNILLALAVGGVLAAAALAAIQAHQLARPLERLAARAARIGDGDFSFTAYKRTRIPEIDHIGTALDISSQRVDTMLANERHFTADATHQLRTGITGIAMRFEILSLHPEADVVSEAQAGLTQTDQLNATIDELLAAARNRSTQERGAFDLTDLVVDHVAEWQPRFSTARRHLSVITAAPAPPVVGTKGLAGQVLDILIDNALKHGAGAVTLMIDGPSVVVIDQGKGVSGGKLKTMFDGPVDPAAKHGRGLPLARRLAQVDGASLDVVGNHPLRMRFRLVRAGSDDNDLAAPRRRATDRAAAEATSDIVDEQLADTP